MSNEKKENFIKQIINDYKLKPQTREEAKRKTKASAIILGSILGVISLLLCIISVFIGLIFAVLTIIAVVATLFLGNRKNDKNFCEKCGEKIDYENGVAWEVIEFTEKTYTIPENANKDFVVKKRFANVRITCHCTKCGETNEFMKKFDVVDWHLDGSVNQYNLQDLVKGYFRL